MPSGAGSRDRRDKLVDRRDKVAADRDQSAADRDQLAADRDETSEMLDQIAFGHEFRAFTGLTPTRYVEVRRRFLREHPGHALDSWPLPTD